MSAISGIKRPHSPAAPKWPRRDPDACYLDDPSELWGKLGVLLAHPVQVALLEALHWLEFPLSPTEFSKLSESEAWDIPKISHHFRRLAELGLVTVVAQRQARGAVESYYFFPVASERGNSPHLR